MSDHFIPIRQYVPPSPSPASTAHPYVPKQGSSGASDLSFQDVLSRQMQSSVEIRQMQTPPVEIPQPDYFAAEPGSGIKRYQPGPADSEIIQSVEEVPATGSRASSIMESIEEVPAAGSRGSSIMESMEEVPAASELLQKAPARIPQGQELESLMLQNAAEYRQMKTIPDLGSGAVSPSRKPVAKPHLSPAYSAFDLSNTHKQSTGSSALTPINADLMKQDPETPVLLQADVESKAAPARKAGKHGSAASQGRWTDPAEGGSSVQPAASHGSRGEGMQASGAEGETKWNVTAARAKRFRESSKPWLHQKIRMPGRLETRMTQQEPATTSVADRGSAVDSSMQASYDMNL